MYGEDLTGFCGSFFRGYSTYIPLVYKHSEKQHPYAIRMVESGKEHMLKDGMIFTSPEQSLKKYFGKKTTELICIHKVPSLNFTYRFKALKEVKFISTRPMMHPIRSIESLYIFDTLPSYSRSKDGPKSQLSNLIKTVPGYKRVRQLYIVFDKMTENVSLKPLQALSHLESLSLRMFEGQLVQNYHHILKLRSLKRLELINPHLTELDKEQNEAITVSNFISQLSSLNHLEFLKISLTTEYNRRCPSSWSRLLDTLSRVEIPAFDVELTDRNNSHIDSEGLRSCIKNIDLLTLEVSTACILSIACGEDNTACQPMKKACKKLRIYYCYKPEPLTEDADQSDINSQISEITPCNQNFQALDLVSKLEILFKYYLGIPFPLSGMTNIKHLKRLCLNIGPIPESRMKGFDQLFHALIANANNLEKLDFMKDRKILNRPNIDHYFSTLYRSADLTNLTSLYFDDRSPCHSLDVLAQLLKHLKYLKNLKTLEIEIFLVECIDPKKEEDIRLDIPEDSKLTEVSFRLPELTKNLALDFIQFILSLSELEVLKVIEGDQSILRGVTDVCSLLKGFKTLKKLRKISIDRRVEYFMMQNDLDNGDPIIVKIKNEIKELFDCNVGMQHLQIESNCPSYQIAYRRY